MIYKVKVKTGIFDSNILFLKGKIKQDKISREQYLIVEKVLSGVYSCFLNIPRKIILFNKVIHLGIKQVAGYKDYTKKEIIKIDKDNKKAIILLSKLEYCKLKERSEINE